MLTRWISIVRVTFRKNIKTKLTMRSSPTRRPERWAYDSISAKNKHLHSPHNFHTNCASWFGSTPGQLPGFIEVAACPPASVEVEDWSSEEIARGRYINLRPYCSLSRALKEDEVARAMDNRSLECCTNPIALQVCHEARMHTLAQYTRLSNLISSAGSFYGGNHDLLHLSLGYLRHRDYPKALQRFCGELLDHFEAVQSS